MKIKYEKFLPYIYLIIGESFSGRHHLYAYWLVLSHPTTTQYVPRDKRKRGGEGRQRFISHIITQAVKKDKWGNEFQTGSSHANEWGRGDFIVHPPSYLLLLFRQIKMKWNVCETNGSSLSFAAAHIKWLRRRIFLPDQPCAHARKTSFDLIRGTIS